MHWSPSGKLYELTLVFVALAGNSLSRLRLDLWEVEVPFLMAWVTIVSTSILFTSRQFLSRIEKVALLASCFFIARDGPPGVVWLYLVSVPIALVATERGREALSWLSRRWKAIVIAYILLHSYGAVIFGSLTLDFPSMEPTVPLLGPMSWIPCIALLCVSDDNSKGLVVSGFIAIQGVLYSQSRAAFLALTLVVMLHLLTIFAGAVGLRGTGDQPFHRSWLPSTRSSTTHLAVIGLSCLLLLVPSMSLTGRYGEANVANLVRSAEALLPSNTEVSGEPIVVDPNASATELGDPMGQRSSWWREGVESWSSAGSPILGVGFGDPILQSTAVEPVSGEKKPVRWLHNDVLELFLRAGLFALLFFAVQLFLVARLGRAISARRVSPLANSLGGWIVLAASASLWLGTQPVIWYPGSYILILMLLLGHHTLASNGEGV